MKWIKIGVIVPSSNTTVEREFSEISNKINEYRITFHTSRIRLEDVTLDGLNLMERETERAATELSTLIPNMIAYACTTGSLFRGPTHHEEIIQRIERITGVKSIATAGSVINALQKLNIKRIVLITPYIDDVNKKEIEFLSSHGIYVVKYKGMGLIKNTEIGSVNPEEVYEFTYNSLEGINSNDYDGIFISCTNLRTFEIINKLEKEVNKPVISSNSATLWEIFNKLNINIPLENLGTLFKRV